MDSRGATSSAATAHAVAFVAVLPLGVGIDRIDGDHLTVMQDRSRATAVAAAIERRLASRPEHRTGLAPITGFERPLVVTTMRWFAAARLAHALTEAGFAVSACPAVSWPPRPLPLARPNAASSAVIPRASFELMFAPRSTRN